MLSTNEKRNTNLFSDVVVHWRRHVKAGRDSAQADRELRAVLAGHHGPSMREELLAVLNR